MHPLESTSAGRPLSLLLRLEQLCDDFEDRWRQGEHPRIEDCLAEFPEAQREAALRELLALEVAYRRKIQETLAPQEYLHRFPEHASLIEEVLQHSTARGPDLSGSQSAAAVSPTTVVVPSRPASAQAPPSQLEPSAPETAAYQAPEDADNTPFGSPGAGHSTIDSADREWQTKYDLIRADPIRTSADAATDSRSTKPLQAAAASENSVQRSGHYVLQSQIGRGGLGCVFLARDPTIGRKVAIKEMRPDARSSAELVARFREEAQITGQLEHPNVVPIYELGDLDDGTPYYAMRLLGKQTLGDAIKRFHADKSELAQKRLALDQLLRAFVGVCQAMPTRTSARCCTVT